MYDPRWDDLRERDDGRETTPRLTATPSTTYATMV
jgi:hypothetical protein